MHKKEERKINNFMRNIRYRTGCWNALQKNIRKNGLPDAA
jgi:hypothetical protein